MIKDYIFFVSAVCLFFLISFLHIYLYNYYWVIEIFYLFWLTPHCTAGVLIKNNARIELINWLSNIPISYLKLLEQLSHLKFPVQDPWLVVVFYLQHEKRRCYTNNSTIDFFPLIAFISIFSSIASFKCVNCSLEISAVKVGSTIHNKEILLNLTNSKVIYFPLVNFI